MIKLSNVYKSFNTQNKVIRALNDVSFQIEDGQTVVIGGENGSGKTVLMSIIAGLEKADSGTVFCESRPGLVFQEAETQILGETVIEDVSFGPQNLGFSEEEKNKAVADALQKTGLFEKANYQARFLSGGEKRRLAVASLLAMKLPVIIFDEPYANLDYSGVKQVNSIIRLLQNEGKTVIILTHELEKCLALAERFIVLFRGELVFDRKMAELSSKAFRNLQLEKWNIKNPLTAYSTIKDLVWL